MLAALLLGAADASLQTTWGNDHTTSSAPSNCSIAVIGASWSAAYFAWRLAIDSKTVPASSICVFEANGRVGGRIDSIHGLPGFDDLAVDMGGYRFIETDLLPAQLVWDALELPTACYDWDCQGGCEGPTNCYVIKDVYGNNCGYATAIERMLELLEAQGGTVNFGFALQSIKEGELTFTNGFKTKVDTVLLGIPHNAIEALDLDVPPLGEKILNDVSTSGLNKITLTLTLTNRFEQGLRLL